jgi:F0F1-type ATP synthase delta subunit
MKHVVVTTAIPLTDALRTEVEKTIEKKFSLTAKQFELKEIVDTRVLGGISISVDSQEYDATVRGKLNRLQGNI